MRLLGICISICLLVACNTESPIVENSITIEGGWDYETTFLTQVPIEDTTSTYRLDLELLHTLDFDYENLYIDIETSFPDGRKLSDDFSLQLADKFGKWEGKCSSESCKKTFTLRDNFRFKDEGTYAFSIKQYSREDVLSGIGGLNLLLYKYPTEK